MLGYITAVQLQLPSSQLYLQQHEEALLVHATALHCHHLTAAT
jgi:hypothetical protein